MKWLFWPLPGSTDPSLPGKSNSKKVRAESLTECGGRVIGSSLRSAPLRLRLGYTYLSISIYRYR